MLTVVAAVIVSPLAALLVPRRACRPCGSRRAGTSAAPPSVYLAERASYATLAGTVSETSRAGGRSRRSAWARSGSAGSTRISPTPAHWEFRGLYLRTVWFPTVEFAYVLPVAAALAWGGWLVSAGHATIGEVTAVALYVVAARRPGRPADLLARRDPGRRQLVRAAGRHRPGAARPHATGDERPDDERLRAEDVRYAYVDGRDVLHGIDLDLEPGERVAVVGPSGAGKSTLGRLLAGIHPPRDGPGRGGRRPARRAPARDAAPRGGARHPGAPRLRRHACGEPPARPAGGDATQQLVAALEAVDALDWVDGAPRGPRDGRRRRRHAAHARAGAAARAGPARAGRPAHARARRGDVAARPARRPAPRALAGRRAGRAARSSPSRTGCTRRTTPTGSPSSRTACYASSAPTTSWWPGTAPTPRSGSRGTATAVSRPEPELVAVSH